MTEKKVRVAALILAAGAARRFGQPKQLLPWGPDNTILGTVIDAVCHHSGVGSINVVLGAYYDSITGTMADKLAGTHIIRNVLWQQGMFSSIIAGLQALANKPDADAILVLLGDMPFITPEITAQFAHLAAGCTTKQPVIMATDQGRPAHPYLIWKQHIGEILSLSGKSGIRPFIQSHFPDAEKIQVPSTAGRQDIDTWESYEQLKPDILNKS